MNIPPSFKMAYEKVMPTLERLEAAVKPLASEIAERYNGSYSGRIKGPESILIKAEKGQYQYPLLEMDDLFACTITVPNSSLIDKVRTDIEATFEVITSRQRSVKPEEFTYNDLNLSLKVKPSSYNRNEAYLNWVFELQIKTLLQQAWANASHDVVYKAKKKTWGLARIASQLRALLEMADSVLANLEEAAETLQGSIEYPNFSERNKIVGLLEETWEPSSLPANLYRAAEVVDSYLKLAKLKADDLPALLEQKQYSRYITAKSLLPTEVIFIILFEEKILGQLGRLKQKKLLITPEMLDLCPKLNRIPQKNRVSLDTSPRHATKTNL